MSKQPIEESAVMRWLLCICDFILIALCMWGVFAWYEAHDPSYIQAIELQTYLTVALVCYLPVTMALPPILLGRVVRVDRIVERVFRMILMYMFFIGGALFLLKNGAIARMVLLSFCSLFFVLITTERLAFRSLVRHVRSRGRNKQFAILVGNCEELGEVYEYMQHDEYGFSVEGIFSNKNPEEDSKMILTGTLNETQSFLLSHPHVTAIYCTMTDVPKGLLMQLYQYSENHLIRFYAMPMYADFLRRNMTASHIGSTMLLSPRPEPLNDLGNRMIKRAFDIVVSLTFLLTLFPVVYVFVAIFIKRQSPGPIFFIQKRSGLKGQEFGCIKFRSMHINKDADRLQATEHDPRKFAFGDFMRRTNIDELPQFINVFLGDMTLVGPRPHMLLHTEEYSHLINKYMVRHWIKPGITGWAQVNGFRGETRTLKQMEDRVHADIWYVENWTFWLDLRIMLKTVLNMIRHNEDNAY